MKKNKAHDALDDDQLWFMENMGGELNKFDAAYERQMPDLEEMEAYLAIQKQELRRKLWRDLARFWLVAIVVLTGTMWMFNRDPIWYIGFQSAVCIGAVGYIGIAHAKKVKTLWKS